MFSTEIPKNIQTLFLSDLHLGFRLAGAACIEALDYFQPKQIYLVGDTVDITRMSRVWCWNREHQAIIDRLIHSHDSGVEVFLLPGNHDPCFGRDPEFLDRLAADVRERIREIVQPLFRLPMQESYIYATLSGKKFVVMHGDQVDHLNAKFWGVPLLGSKIFDYSSVILPNWLTLEIRNFFKLILTRPRKIESRAIAEARHQQMDGLIMGHLHEPLIRRTEDGLFVGNTGDWVENSSMIVESLDGRLILVNDGIVSNTFEF